MVRVQLLSFESVTLTLSKVSKGAFVGFEELQCASILIFIHYGRKNFHIRNGAGPESRIKIEELFYWCISQPCTC